MTFSDAAPVTFRPIGDTQYGQEPFRGTFDGQGHTIKNLVAPTAPTPRMARA